MRLILGALAGAVVVFIISAILHTVSPLGTMGISVLPDEDEAMRSIRAAAPRSGLYLFPGMDPKKHPTDAETKAWEQKLRSGPYGLLIVTLEGSEPINPRQLGLEFLTTFLAALVAAYIISLTAASYGVRAMIVAFLAVFAFFSVGASHWIWYRFPIEFVLAALLIELIAWLPAGLAMAKIVRPRAA